MSLTLDIAKRLGDFRLDVSLQTTGGVLGLLGASGCGKSKTLQCIAGIEKPDRGKIILDGHTFFDSECHVNVPVQNRRIGYLFQHYALFPNMTVAENIACGIRGHVPGHEKENIIHSMMERLHLTGLEKQRPGELSGGQQQRVALGRILVNKPELLLLDEPFSALDSFLKAQVMTELREVIKQFRKDVIVVTHNRDEAYQLCDTIAVLDKGHLEVTGKTEDVFSQPQTRAAAMLLGCRNIETAQKRGSHEVYVPAWNITLQCACPVADGLCAVGIRDHAFSWRETANRFPVRIAETVAQPFSRSVTFRYASQQDTARPLWMTFPKNEYENISEYLGINPKDILLLYR